MAEEALDVAACLERVRERDEAAARELVDHLYPLVIKIVRAHLPWRMSEEDLAQDVYLKMFANLQQYRGEMPLEHWVSRIAVTTCINKLRYQKRRPELRWADLGEQEAEVMEATLKANSTATVTDGESARDVLDKLMGRLGPEDRLVINLLDLQQKSVAEIMEITGWKASAIKVRAHRARKKLKQHLEDLEQGMPHE